MEFFPRGFHVFLLRILFREKHLSFQLHIHKIQIVQEEQLYWHYYVVGSVVRCPYSSKELNEHLDVYWPLYLHPVHFHTIRFQILPCPFLLLLQSDEQNQGNQQSLLKTFQSLVLQNFYLLNTSLISPYKHTLRGRIRWLFSYY